MGTPQATARERHRLGRTTKQPVIIMMSGLPGTGKTYFSRKLAERLHFTIIESDHVRKQLFITPKYTPAENTQVFRFINEHIEKLIDDRVSLIFDATNLEERHRRSIYRIAEKHRARMIIVRVDAPPELVQKRLTNRINRPDDANYSDADWSIYSRMKSNVEKISVPHFSVNTARDINPIIDKVVKEVSR